MPTPISVVNTIVHNCTKTFYKTRIDRANEQICVSVDGKTGAHTMTNVGSNDTWNGFGLCMSSTAVNNGSCHFIMGWMKRDTSTPIPILALDMEAALIFNNHIDNTLAALSHISPTFLTKKSPYLGAPLTIGDTFALTLDISRQTASFYRSITGSGSELEYKGIVFTNIVDAASLVPAFLTANKGIVIECLDCTLYARSASGGEAVVMVI